MPIILLAGHAGAAAGFGPKSRLTHHKITKCYQLLGQGDQATVLVARLGPALAYVTGSPVDSAAVWIADRYAGAHGEAWLHPVDETSLREGDGIWLAERSIQRVWLNQRLITEARTRGRTLGFARLRFGAPTPWPSTVARPGRYTAGDVIKINRYYFVVTESTRDRNTNPVAVTLLALGDRPGPMRVEPVLHTFDVSSDEPPAEFLKLPLGAWPEVLGSADVVIGRQVSGRHAGRAVAFVERITMGDPTPEVVLKARLENYRPLGGERR